MAEEVEPAQPLLLVGAEQTAEVRPGVDRAQALELAELGPRGGERLVDLEQFLLGEQRVEQRRLGRLEPQPLDADAAKRQQHPVLFQPRLGQQPLRPVPKRDHLVAPADGGEDVGEAHLLLLPVRAVVGHRAAELEPVDAARHREARRARPAERLLVSADDPALRDELRHDRRHRLDRQQHRLGAAPARPQPRRGELLEGRTLRLRVAADQPRPLRGDGRVARVTLEGPIGGNGCARVAECLGIRARVLLRGGIGEAVNGRRFVRGIRLRGSRFRRIGRLGGVAGCGGSGGSGGPGGEGDEPPRLRRAHPHARVVEPHLRQQLRLRLPVEGGVGAEEVQVRRRLDPMLVPRQRLGQVHLRQLREHVHPVEEPLDVRRAHPQRTGRFAAQRRAPTLAPELADPTRGAAVVQRPGPVLPEDDAVQPRHHEVRRFDAHPLVPAAQLGADLQVPVGRLVADHPERPRAVRLVIVPVERRLAARALLIEVDRAPPGRDHPFQQRPLRRAGQAEAAVAPLAADALDHLPVLDPGRAEHQGAQLAVLRVRQRGEHVGGEPQRLGLAPAARAGGEGGALAQLHDEPAVAGGGLGQHDVADLPLGREQVEPAAGVVDHRRPQQGEAAHPRGLGVRPGRDAAGLALPRPGRPHPQARQLFRVRGLVAERELHDRRPDVLAVRALGERLAGALGPGVRALLAELHLVGR